MNIFSNNAMTAFELRLPASESETGNTFTGKSFRRSQMQKASG